LVKGCLGLDFVIAEQIFFNLISEDTGLDSQILRAQGISAIPARGKHANRTFYCRDSILKKLELITYNCSLLKNKTETEITINNH
tara:strand:+ start:444 stop:698 length:255 start_codon:yes stop_codon:yes gene_type:complete